MCCSFQLFFFISSSPLPFSFFLFLSLFFRTKFLYRFLSFHSTRLLRSCSYPYRWLVHMSAFFDCMFIVYIYIYICIISLLSSLRSSKRSLRRTLRCSFRSRQIQSSSHRLMRWCLTTQRFTKILSQSSSWWQQCKLFHRWRTTILFLFTVLHFLFCEYTRAFASASARIAFCGVIHLHWSFAAFIHSRLFWSEKALFIWLTFLHYLVLS